MKTNTLTPREERLTKIAICELKSLLELPAGTTYYFCDIHGQGDKFFHIINNKAGTIKRKIDDILGDRLDPDERLRLLKLCYFPREELSWEKSTLGEAYQKSIEKHLFSLGRLIRHIGSKNTRREFYQQIESSIYHTAIIELVTASNEDKIIRNNEITYQKTMIAEYRKQGLLEELVSEMVRILKNLMIHKYIINGDIPDRGPDTAKILDHLMTDSRVEINWGNHDLLWMGAGAGSLELILELVRIQLRYGHHAILEEDYKIDLQPLADFSAATYRQDPAKGFAPSAVVGERFATSLLAKMQKAVAVILWKLEAERSQTLGVRPYLNLLGRDQAGQLFVEIEGKRHTLLDQDFPTIDLERPTRLTGPEKQILKKLAEGFKKSARFRRQMEMLARRGSLYHIQDGILSFHATVPMASDGSLAKIEVLGEALAGRKLFDRLDELYKEAFETKKPRQEVLDLFYQGWKGPHSWTFGKSGMETFTRALVADKSTHREEKSSYYVFLANPETSEKMARAIMEDFKRDDLPTGIQKIFNGHIPVKLERQESAIRAGGAVICGDGGFSEAYGDIGFVLVTTSSGIYLNKLGHAVTAEEVLKQNADLVPVILWSEQFSERKQLAECNIATEIQARIAELEARLG